MLLEIKEKHSLHGSVTHLSPHSHNFKSVFSNQLTCYFFQLLCLKDCFFRTLSTAKEPKSFYAILQGVLVGLDAK